MGSPINVGGQYPFITFSPLVLPPNIDGTTHHTITPIFSI